MIIAELIKELNKYPQDANVFCLVIDGNPVQGDGTCIDSVFQVVGHEEYSGVYIVA